VTRGQLPQKAGLLGLNGGGAAAADRGTPVIQTAFPSTDSMELATN